MNSLAYLTYHSDALLARPEDLESIADKAGRYNASVEITGCLFHADGCYFQILEGPLRHLFSLMLRLEKDSRHRCIQITGIAPIIARQFSGFPLAVLSEAETAKLVAAADPHIRRSKAYLEAIARDSTLAQLAEMMKIRRQRIRAAA